MEPLLAAALAHSQLTPSNRKKAMILQKKTLNSRPNWLKRTIRLNHFRPAPKHCKRISSAKCNRSLSSRWPSKYSNLVKSQKPVQLYSVRLINFEFKLTPFFCRPFGANGVVKSELSKEKLADTSDVVDSPVLG